MEIEYGESGAVPLSLVRDAVKRSRDAAKHAKREGDPFLAFDEVWCVFDVDEHPNVRDALQLAASNGVRVAVSNESFELWLLLHFEHCTSHSSRVQLRQKLKCHLPEYDKSIDFVGFKPNVEAAIDRAVELDDQAVHHSMWGRNPTTSVHRLVTSILGKEEDKGGNPQREAFAYINSTSFLK